MQKSKKRFQRLSLPVVAIVIFTCCMSILPVKVWAIPEDRQLPRLVDEADLLSDSEESELNTTLDEISERQECDVAVVTVNSLDGKSAREYADDFYDDYGYGYGDDDSGILFLIGMDDRKWAITTYGYGITAFTDYGLEYMEEQFLPDLKDGEYKNAFTEYASICDDLLTQAREGNPYDVDTASESQSSGWFTYIFWLIISLLIGFVTAFIIALVKKSKLKSVKKQVAANVYKKEGSMSITTSEDRFINSIVTRRLISREDDHESGGSSTHMSSSGRSHGGSSGSF